MTYAWIRKFYDEVCPLQARQPVENNFAMISFLQSIIYSAIYQAEQLSQSQFLLLSALVVLVGGFCLRGFGERI